MTIGKTCEMCRCRPCHCRRGALPGPSAFIGPNKVVAIPAEIIQRATHLTCYYLRRACEVYGISRDTPRQMCDDRKMFPWEFRAMNDALTLLKLAGFDPDAPAGEQDGIERRLFRAGTELRMCLEAAIRGRDDP